MGTTPSTAAGRGPGGFGGRGAGGRAGGRGAGGGAGGAWSGRARQGGASRLATVYVPAEKGKLQPVQVRTSITDGSFTAVASNQLKAGDEVVVGLATARASSSSSSRPPTLGGGGGRGPRM